MGTGITPFGHNGHWSNCYLYLFTGPNGGRDEYIAIESVRRFVADLEPLYGKDRNRLRFVPFPEAGHGVTDAMWKEAQEWIVRGLEKAPPAANPR